MHEVGWCWGLADNWTHGSKADTWEQAEDWDTESLQQVAGNWNHRK